MTEPTSTQTISSSNQVSELPESINTVIPAIKPLKNRKELILWKWDIKATLSGCDLLDSINIDGLLQCPDTEDVNYCQIKPLDRQRRPPTITSALIVEWMDMRLPIITV
jgi:hypothetical protein